VAYEERDVGRIIRQAEGQWDRAEQVWKLRYAHVKALGLEDRIIER